MTTTIFILVREQCTLWGVNQRLPNPPYKECNHSKKRWRERYTVCVREKDFHVVFVWKGEWERVVLLWKIFQRPSEISTVGLRCIKQVRICRLWYKTRWLTMKNSWRWMMLNILIDAVIKHISNPSILLYWVAVYTGAISALRCSLSTPLNKFTKLQYAWTDLSTRTYCSIVCSRSLHSWIQFLAIRKWAGILFNLNKRRCGFLVTSNHEECQWINLKRKSQSVHWALTPRYQPQTQCLHWI